MEWMNRGQRQGQSAGHQSAPGAQTAHAGAKQSIVSQGIGKLQIAQVGLLFSVTVLVVAVVWFVALGGGSKREGSYVDDTKLQAVFLNGGQVYFGKINNLNDQFLSMNSIYYLRVNQQVQPNQASNSTSANDISLVKLGCELHGPQDNMVINRDQIIFWENLKEDGQVAKAVKDYKAQNTGEQKCDQSAGGSTQQTTTGTGNSTGTGSENDNNTNSSTQNNTNTSR